MAVSKPGVGKGGVGRYDSLAFRRSLSLMDKKQKSQPKSQPQRVKHLPQRTCVACREVAGKRGLVRIVRTADGVVVDPSGKMAGRGAYVHPSRDCWVQVTEGRRLDQALRTRLSSEDRQRIADFMATLPETGIETRAETEATASVDGQV